MSFNEEAFRLPDIEEPLDEDGDGVEDEIEEDEDVEEQARAENGEVCEDCGAEFTEANGSAVLCSSCHDAAEDAGVKEHAPLSKYPVK